jgi:hypothetical protein
MKGSATTRAHRRDHPVNLNRHSHLAGGPDRIEGQLPRNILKGADHGHIRWPVHLCFGSWHVDERSLRTPRKGKKKKKKEKRTMSNQAAAGGRRDGRGPAQLASAADTLSGMRARTFEQRSRQPACARGGREKCRCGTRPLSSAEWWSPLDRPTPTQPGPVAGPAACGSATCAARDAQFAPETAACAPRTPEKKPPSARSRVQPCCRRGPIPARNPLSYPSPAYHRTIRV